MRRPFGGPGGQSCKSHRSPETEKSYTVRELRRQIKWASSSGRCRPGGTRPYPLTQTNHPASASGISTRGCARCAADRGRSPCRGRFACGFGCGPGTRRFSPGVGGNFPWSSQLVETNPEKTKAGAARRNIFLPESHLWSCRWKALRKRFPP
jgi:hypothetical protein